MQVFKFGGASVKDAASVKNVVSILQKQVKEPTIVVISAMGKTTNKLEELARSYFYKENNTQQIFDDLKNYHLSIARDLFEDPKDKVFDDLENVFVEMLWALEEEPAFVYNHHYDQFVAQGEILSTKIVSAYLDVCGVKNKWLDVRDVIQTDNTYREGKVNYELCAELTASQLLPLFEKNQMVLTQGFIGGTSENYTTTLGREGSDYSAALLAYFTNAEKVIIWKDVPGVLNADPKYFKNTKKMDELTYHDAIELTYFGASVIHPKTIKPLQNKNIPLYVRSFVKPDEPGTVIKDTERRTTVTSYIFKENQILLSIMPKDFSFIAEDNLSEIFSIFSKYNVHVHMMQNSAISFSICTDNDQQKITPMTEELNKNFRLLYNDNVQLMTIRNYDQETVTELSRNKEILIEQKSRNTHQMVMRDARD